MSLHGRRRFEPDRHRSLQRQPLRSKVGPWSHGPIPVIGLVGGIGSGKSAVAAFMERKGAFVIDADKVGHALLEHEPCRSAVIRRFGPGVVIEPEHSAGMAQIDRKSLAKTVFADTSALRALEAILHPRMIRTFKRVIRRATGFPRYTAVVLDAAVLFEAGWHTLCDLVVFVDSPAEARLQRVSAARGWSEQDLARREAAQLPLKQKKSKANVLLDNSGDLAALQSAVDEFWNRRVTVKAGAVRSISTGVRPHHTDPNKNAGTTRQSIPNAADLPND